MGTERKPDDKADENKYQEALWEIVHYLDAQRKHSTFNSNATNMKPIIHYLTLVVHDFDKPLKDRTSAPAFKSLKIFTPEPERILDTIYDLARKGCTSRSPGRSDATHDAYIKIVKISGEALNKPALTSEELKQGGKRNIGRF